MKKLILIATLALTAFNPAFAAEDGPFKLKKGFFVANDYPGGQKDVIHSDGHVALREIQDFNERIGRAEHRVTENRRIFNSAAGWVSDTEERTMLSTLRYSETELEELKASKLKLFGEDGDKIAKKLEEKSNRLGRMYAEARDKAELAEKYGRKAPIKTQAFSNLEDEVADLSKQLFKGIKADYLKTLKQAGLRGKKFPHWVGRRAKRAAVVALPLAGAAAVGVALDGDNSSAQASTIKDQDVPVLEQNDQQRVQEDIEVLDAN